MGAANGICVCETSEAVQVVSYVHTSELSEVEPCRLSSDVALSQPMERMERRRSSKRVAIIPQGSGEFEPASGSRLHQEVTLRKMMTSEHCDGELPSHELLSDINMTLLESLKQVDPHAPFRVVRFPDLKAYGQLPRSDARLAIPYDEMEDDIPVIFLSHRWFRPWRSQEECEQNGHTWAGEPHPDDEMRTKYHLTVSGIELLARQRNWELSRLGVWMDYACIEQDDLRLRSAGVRSLIGYMCRCSLVMIPTSTKPDFPTVHRMPSEYGERAWTRLEALGCYVQGLLNDQKPELYFSAPGNHVDKLDYVLLPHTMPSSGILAEETDRSVILRHETVLLDHVHESAMVGSEAAKGPALVAAAGLGRMEQVKQLLHFLKVSQKGDNLGVNTQDHSGITPLWSAARQGRLDLVRYLLRERADPDIAAHSGLGPLHTAAQQGYTDVATVLIDYNAQVNKLDKQGNSPLLWAIQNWHEDIVQLLLDSGAQSLSTAKRIVERLRSSEESDEHEVQWATRVLAAIQRAMDASASEQRGPKLALQRKQSFLDRANRTVEMAVNRATKKKLSRRFSSAISMDSSTSRMSSLESEAASTPSQRDPRPINWS